MTDRRHVLFATYNGVLEPLGLRQGLAYVAPLTDEFDVSVVSFEKPADLEDGSRLAEMRARLEAAGIAWSPLRYRRRPPVLSTLMDIARGARQIRRRHAARSVDLVHARGYPPAAMARRAGAAGAIPYLFDIRGLLADEYVDGGLWREGGLPWRMTRWAERGLLRDAGGIVTLTRAIEPEVRRRRAAAGAPDTLPWEVIPCCVDTDTFRPDAEARTRVRAELGMGDEPLAVYAGSVGTWYPLEPMVRFLADLSGLVRGLRTLLLLNGPEEPVRAALRSAGVPGERITVVRAHPEDVPAYLASADLGVCFVQPSPSKRASSPTKVAEYLACGLPVVLNDGVGDLGELAGEPAVVVARSLSPEHMLEAAVSAASLLELPRDVPRRLAEETFDLRRVGVPRYRSLYRRLLAAPEALP